MKCHPVVLLVALATVMAGPAPSLVASDPAKVRATHVVLVSIDGLTASYFDDPRAKFLTTAAVNWQ